LATCNHNNKIVDDEATSTTLTIDTTLNNVKNIHVTDPKN